MQNELSQIPLFASLPDQQLKNLGQIVRTRQFHADQTIFHEGDPAAGFYIILSGRVKIYKLSPDGKEQILHLFGPGEPFGEAPVFSGNKFPAHAQSMQDSTLLYITREDLLQQITEDPLLAMNMLAVLSRRLKEFTKLIEDLALKELPQRLAAYVLHIQALKGEGKNVHLDISKGILSKILGTSQETLSRTFNRLNREGILLVDKKNIFIQDQEQLVRLSNGQIRLND